MISKAEFLARRKIGIGGSDIAGIIGISPWSTPREVWYSKVNHDANGNPLPEPIENDAMYWGTVLEDVVAQEYAKRTGRKVFRCSNMFNAKDASGRGKEYFIANCDRFVSECGNSRPVFKGKIRTNRILECKTASAYGKDNWGESGTQDIPEYYLSQVQWYMGVTGCTVTDVAVLIGGRDFRIYEINRDDNIIDYLFEKGEEFWMNYVIPDVIPPLSEKDDPYHAWGKGDKEKTKYVDTDTLNSIELYVQKKQQVAELEAECDALRNKICNYMEDASVLMDNGNVKVCSWTACQGRVSYNYSKMIKDLNISDDTLAKYRSVGKDYRTFKLGAEFSKRLSSES